MIADWTRRSLLDQIIVSPQHPRVRGMCGSKTENMQTGHQVRCGIVAWTNVQGVRWSFDAIKIIGMLDSSTNHQGL